MHFILLAAVASVTVALILKSASKRSIDLVQVIGWGYVSALGLVIGLLRPAPLLANQELHNEYLLIVLGVMLPLVFLFYSQSLRTAGLIRSEIAQRLSLLIGLGAAYLLFNDTLTPLKGIAIVAGLIAMFTMLQQKTGNHEASGKQASYWLLLTWLGYGVIDITLKLISSTGIPLGTTLTYAFSIALIIMGAVIVYRRLAYGRLLQTQALIAGLLMGLFNVANISFYLKAHQALSDQPAIVFAGMNILVVALGVIAGSIIYKEALTRTTLFALAASAVSIGLLAIAQWR